MARSIGHDINNLLTGIAGNVSLALDETPGTHRARPRLDHALLATRRAACIVRELLVLAGGGAAAGQDGTPRPDELLLRSRGLLESALPGRAVLGYDLAPGLPGVELGETDLRGVALALVRNAGEALPEGRGGVTLRAGTGAVPRLPEEEGARVRHLDAALRPDGARVWLEVEDEGTGMPPEILERIAEPLFSTRAGHRGLGLHYVHAVVSGAGGGWRVATGDRGTRVQVLLPATRSGEETRS